MAGTETNNDFDEFIVDSCKLTLVNNIQNKVERMFSINIYVDESTDNKGEKSWLRVDGQKCDRKDARVMFLKGLLSVFIVLVQYARAISSTVQFFKIELFLANYLNVLLHLKGYF